MSYLVISVHHVHKKMMSLQINMLFKYLFLISLGFAEAPTRFLFPQHTKVANTSPQCYMPHWHATCTSCQTNSIKVLKGSAGMSGISSSWYTWKSDVKHFVCVCCLLYTSDAADE